MAAMPPAVLPKPRRRWFLRFLFLLGLLAALVWFTPALIANTGLKDMVLARALSGFKGQVTVNRLSLGWFSPVVLEDIQLRDTNGELLGQIPRASTSHNLLALVRDRDDLGTITLERPAITLVVQPGQSTNWEDALASYFEPDSSATTTRPRLSIAVREGELTLQTTGKPGESVLRPCEVSVSVPSARTEAILITASIAGAGQLNGEFSLGEQITGSIKAEAFQLQSLEPLLVRLQPDVRLAGALTGDTRAEYQNDVLQLAGKISIRGLDHSGPWFDGDHLRMEETTLPHRLSLKPGILDIEEAVLICDFGTASLAGALPLTTDWTKLTGQTGLHGKCEVDIARLATTMPRLFHLKPGTELQDGRISLSLSSSATPTGTNWIGSVQTTSLKGVRAGKSLVWDEPLKVNFNGKLRPDGWPEFELLTCQSDFIGLAARGSVEEFTARANLFLDRLSEHLEEFVDLNELKLAGQAELTVETSQAAKNGHRLEVSGKLTNLAISDASGPLLREPEMLVKLQAEGQFDPAQSLRLTTATGSIVAAQDELRMSLLQPIADLRAIQSAEANVSLSGDLARWRNRLSGIVSLPAEWQLGGQALINSTLSLRPDGLTLKPTQAEVTQAVFRGAGLNLQEPKLSAKLALLWERATGQLRFQDIELLGQELRVNADQLTLQPTPDSFTLNGTAKIQGQLHRLQQILQLQSDPAGSDAMNGLTRGTVELALAKIIGFQAQFEVEQFRYGLPQQPLWQEPLVKLSLIGEYDEQADLLRLKQAVVQRAGLTLQATGSLNQPSRLQELELAGTVNYDLAQLEPQLREYLGRGAEFRGQAEKPFALRGTLGQAMKKAVAGVTQLTVPKAQPSILARLIGEATLNWQSIKAYGFEVGPADLNATLKEGRLQSNMITANFAGGQVRIEPTLDLTGPGYPLTLKTGRIIERAKLTPEACASALGYALPAIANAAQADGLISFDLDKNTIPLADPTQAQFMGKLQVHQATVSPGPLVSQLVSLFGGNEPRLKLSGEQSVPIRMEKGRVHHENFTIKIGETDIISSGSVGVDGSLLLVLDVPIPPRLVESALTRFPAIKQTLAKQRLKLPVQGTLAKPQLNVKALEVNAQQIIAESLKNVTGELLKEGRGRLLEELLKKANPPKK